MKLNKFPLLLLLFVTSYACDRNSDVFVQKNEIILLDKNIIIHFENLNDLKLLRTRKTGTGRLIFCKDLEHKMNLEIALTNDIYGDRIQSSSVINDTLKSEVELLPGESLFTSELIINEGILGRNNCKYSIRKNEFKLIYEKELYVDKNSIKLTFISLNKYCNLIIFNKEMKKLLDQVKVFNYDK